MARTVKLAPAEKSAPKATRVVSPSRYGVIRRNLSTIVGAAALVAAGALAGTALAHDGPNGRHPGAGAEARMEMRGGHMGNRPPKGDRPESKAHLTGTVASANATQLSITLADGSTKSVVLDGMSQYFTKTAATAADVTVGSTVLVDAEKPEGGPAANVASIAVLANGLSDARVHLGHPAKVTAVNGGTLTLEVVTPRGTKTITVTIGANTLISKIASATNTDLTVGSSVVVDLGREAAAAKSVLIVK